MTTADMFLEYHGIRGQSFDFKNQNGTDDFLEHHGIKGQKWGVRRFQNEDRTRTPAGKKHEALLAKLNIDKKTLKKVAIGVGAGLAGAALLGGAYYLTSGSVDLTNAADFVYRMMPKAEKTPVSTVAAKKPSKTVQDIVKANKNASVRRAEKLTEKPKKVKDLIRAKPGSKADKAVDSIFERARGAASKARTSASNAGYKASKLRSGASRALSNSSNKSSKGVVKKAGQAVSNWRASRAYDRAMSASMQQARASEGISRQDVHEFIDKMQRLNEMTRTVGR